MKDSKGYEPSDYITSVSNTLNGLEVWNAVKKYLNLYHHQAVKENIDVETVEGMPINIIEKELKALELIINKGVAVGMLQLKEVGLNEYNDFIGDKSLFLTKEEYNLLKEVLKDEN